MTPRSLTLTGLPGVPLVAPGDDLAALVLDALARAGETLADGDTIAVSQKIVSKAEGRIVELREVAVSDAARRLAAETEKDARLVELILRESVRIVRTRPGLIIAETRHGIVLANAGIDASNVAQAGGADTSVLLLPEDPDGSAARLREAIRDRAGVDSGIVVCDSLGRAWRNGTVGTALGASGLPALLDLRGAPDLHGRALRVSEIGLADSIAAAATLVMGEAGEGCPVVLVRGAFLPRGEGRAADLVRPAELDLFR
jgi:coenzyme F420-0:L-glutamate ligase/coenzyme F420-1:gamma-L-glutamate ligase